ncbi:MAG: glycosyltransferase family 4 protein [Clostridiales bacterium]|nr:glycosyltransferase family 4 protein [Clostridiales bacterium]
MNFVKRKKITFFTNATAPYRTLQIRELSKIDGITIQVCYYEKKTRQWNIEKIGNDVEEKWLNMIPPFDGRIHWKLQLHKGLADIVRKSDIVISGSYYTISDNVLVGLCKRYHKPFVLLMDGFEPHRIYEKENGLKFHQKKWVLKNTSYIWGNGTVCREYYTKRFQYPAERIINQCLTVDVEKIAAHWTNRDSLREKIQNRYGIASGEHIVMYSGRLVKIKNVELLIRAVAALADKEAYTVLIAGDGEMRAEYEKLAEELGVKLCITGFIKKQEELFEVYYAADCLVLPSVYDPWGLVINEAMAAHLPVICTTYCGAGMDLIRDGFNGYVIQSLKPEELAERVEECILHKKEWGEHSWEMIQDWTFAKSAENFKELLFRLEQERLCDNRKREGYKSGKIGR